MTLVFCIERSNEFFRILQPTILFFLLWRKASIRFDPVTCLCVKNESTILILQDRSIGLESLQDQLRRVQLFALFSYAINRREFESYLDRKTPDILLLVTHRFE